MGCYLPSGLQKPYVFRNEFAVLPACAVVLVGLDRCYFKDTALERVRSSGSYGHRARYLEGEWMQSARR